MAMGSKSLFVPGLGFLFYTHCKEEGKEDIESYFLAFSN